MKKWNNELKQWIDVPDKPKPLKQSRTVCGNKCFKIEGMSEYIIKSTIDIPNKTAHVLFYTYKWYEDTITLSDKLIEILK